MEILIGLIFAAAVVAGVWATTRALKRRVVFEFERGLKYSNGQFREVLEPGRYWYSPWWTSILTIDVRPRWIAVSGQEVLTSDGVTIKLSVAARYAVADPAVAVNQVHDVENALYTELQLALREIVSGVDSSALLASRSAIAERLMELASPKATQMGVALMAANVKDMMLPGKLKEMFAQVVNARLEGLAALERARGEQAALRNLANAAQLIDQHPHLIHLRVLQVLGESSGNRISLELPPVNAGLSESRPPSKPKAAVTRKSAAKPRPAAKRRPRASR